MTIGNSGYKATVLVPRTVAATLSEAFEAAFETTEDPPSIASFEEPDGKTWRIELYFASAPDETELIDLVEGVCKRHQRRPPDLAVEPLPAIDWVSESQKFLKPVRAGVFYLHGSHDEASRDEGTIDLLIEAGQAFGTGQHETTKGCLLMLGRLRQAGFAPRHALDVGCGSGVLAIAIARAWQIPVLATDVDRRAVTVTKENAEKNNIPVLHGFGAQWGVLALEAAGTRHSMIDDGAPFDLVVANILAEPLVEMAGGVAECLAPEGRLLLSGLLEDQAESVVGAYSNEGLSEIDRITLGNWPTILLACAER